MATVQELRDEISQLAKTIEARDASITDHAEKTDELCRATLAKCNETIAAIELTVKNLGAQVDTKAIAQEVQFSPGIPHQGRHHRAIHQKYGSHLSLDVLPMLENHPGIGGGSQIRMVETDLENRLDDLHSCGALLPRSSLPASSA